MVKFLIFIAIINLLTFFAYFYDKNSARKRGWRIPEKSLHLLAVLGGSPAALFASYRLRHKNRKSSFKLTLWVIILLQLLVVAAFITSPGLLNHCCSPSVFIKKFH